MPKATITHSEYLQLLGLGLMAKQHDDALRAIVHAAGLVVGEEEPNSGHAGDAFWCSASPGKIDEMLQKLHITVEPPPAAAAGGVTKE